MVIIEFIFIADEKDVPLMYQLYRRKILVQFMM